MRGQDRTTHSWCSLDPMARHLVSAVHTVDHVPKQRYLRNHESARAVEHPERSRNKKWWEIRISNSCDAWRGTLGTHADRRVDGSHLSVYQFSSAWLHPQRRGTKLLLFCHPRRLAFEKMSPSPRVVSRAPVRLQVVIVAFSKTHRWEWRCIKCLNVTLKVHWCCLKRVNRWFWNLTKFAAKLELSKSDSPV
jgi:hypothetical protein